VKTRRRALVLQGGGALGAYAYGVIKALYEQPDFSLDVVTGVSIGAINAAVLVGAKDDPIRALDELWRERLAIRNWPFLPPMLDRYSSLLANPAMYWIRPSYVYTPLLAPFLETSIYDITALRRTLADLIDLNRLNRSEIHLVVSSVDIETGERELPTGEDGEIIIRGPQVMQGYWKAPEETARALRDGWLYTGDIGHVDADGFTYIVDRKKEMIKYKGFGIAPAELESLLMEHPAVLDSAVIGIPDDEAGEVPKGFVVIRKGFDVTPEEIVAFANGKLAGYKKIHSVEFIEAILKVASGKILRRELKDMEKARRAGEL